jgi:hypothetical protein|uniref:Uncharacterized protein n=1 Tax=Siphoviridae sp. cttU829 TaxID=2823605 RepID=A0A8S5LC61_9CAUD|nr:MAG TPA: hypothetical protein [Siphoviridae sp. cttU829]
MWGGKFTPHKTYKTMKQELRDLSLPEFAFVEDDKPNGKLHGRNVILHTRSMSVIEVLDKDEVLYIEPHVLTCEFDYINPYAAIEHKVAILHVCATMDVVADRGAIINSVLDPAADWFCQYCEWEDKNIQEEGLL